MIKDKEYYYDLRQQCLSMKNNHQLTFGQDIIKYIYPFIRNYQLEIQGEENIPKNTNVIFLVNHSNSHDFFTAYEMFSLLNRRGSVMAATDCLTPITKEIFNISNATLLDRKNKKEREESILKLSNKILSGYDGLIFGESTWNIHPTLPMHNIRTGATQIALITDTPIIPTIFEYVEEKGLFKKETELYKKCIIRFGKPITIDDYNKLINNTNNIKEEMINLRKNIWQDYNIIKNIDEINKIEYINHTYLKKYKALGFTYDSAKEFEYILFKNGEAKENEYTLDTNGNLIPGITPKNFQMNKILRR